MPGKHAPESQASFYLSLSRWGALAFGALGVVAAIVLVLMSGGDSPQKGSLAASTTPTPTPTATVKSSPAPTKTTSTAPRVHTPKQTSVAVLNGTLRPGLAKRVGEELAKEGYDVVKKADGPKDTEVTTIYYKPGWLAEANALKKKHPEMSRVAPAGDLPFTADSVLTVLIGADYP